MSYVCFHFARYNASTDKLEYSRVTVRAASLHPIVLQAVRILGVLRLMAVTELHKDSKFDGEATITFNNLTLINLALVWFGPMHEDTLTKLLLCVQVLGSCVAFVIRYPLASFFYD